jgi:glycosyltransferase involved in cell wall biosynthesis
MNNPSAAVSVIIPVYNGERYLAAAIESVLAQTHPPFEVIVIDDGSGDGGGEVARGFGPSVRCHRQSHRGAAAARNQGVRLATGDFLAFLDADDLWLPDKLTRQTALLTADASLEAVFGHVRQFFSPDISAATRQSVRFIQEVMPGYVAETLLIRRESFLRVGDFDIRRSAGEFVDWFARAQEKGLSARMLEEVLALRRIHDANMGILRRDENRGEYLQAVKAALDRRRSAKTDEIEGE